MNRVVIIGMFFIFTLNLSGQLNIGFGGGFTYSTSIFPNFELVDAGFRNGFFLEVNPSYNFSKKLTSDFSIQLVQKGFEMKSELGNTNIKYTYFCFNPSIEYYVLDQISISIGSYAGLRMDEEQRLPNEEWVSTKGFKTVKDFDYGVTGKIKLYISKFYTSISYNLGYANIANVNFSDQAGNVVDDVIQMNRNIQIGLGYIISFNRK